MSREAGAQIAQYRLERRLGGGGMGEVFLAHDARLDRLVAIKFLTAPSDPQARRRLLREARAVAALDHHGICAVYEVGTDTADGDFIVMQYLEGETLAARLRRGRMRPDEALNFGAQIAEALMAAHRRGIVHRDLKPQNIIVTPAGTPKLLDFGLATHAANTPAAANAMTISQVTDHDMVVGTPGYMSPEQARNEPADFRSDVFALGCVLYECLSGHRAFPGATTAEALGQVLHVDPPPVSTTVRELGPAYDALCERLLHKIADERFQSAEEVLGAIRALTPSTRFPAGSSVAIPVRRSRALPRVAWALAAALIGLLVFQFWPRPAALPVVPPDPARWYGIGVDAMRDGTYAAARSAFSSAIALFPRYPQAFSRLAEANIALDDEKGAGDALLQVARLVPDRSRLDVEERLRFDAASAAATRQRDTAIQAYQQLADRQPNDAGRWLDLGRALEAAVPARLADATAAYEKALKLDGLSAAALLRMGVIKARAGQTADGLTFIDKAIDQYRRQAKAEGEAEALLRKGSALGTLGQADAARSVLDRVLQLAIDDRFPAQRIGAQLALARLDYAAGKFSAAEDLAKRAVDDAVRDNLPTLAAGGLIELAQSLILKNFLPQAEVHLAESARLAKARESTRIEMRARLQRASLMLQFEKPQAALDLAADPAKYFENAGEARLTADANLILSRAHEGLEHFSEANRLALMAVAFADKAGDDVRRAQALENLAGQLTKSGRLPEALAQRERIEAIHQKKEPGSVPKDLTNRAELLILMGRSRDADAVLRDVEGRIAKGEEAYVERRVSVAVRRALLATTERRWADVTRAAAQVETASLKGAQGTAAVPDSLRLFARVLAEHALAQLGRSRTAPELMAKWPLEAIMPRDRRDWAYWVAQTLLARGEADLARQVSAAALAEAAKLPDFEVTWRLAAVTAEAEKRRASGGAGASISAQARTTLDQLIAAWAGAETTYLSRPDLVTLVKNVR